MINYDWGPSEQSTSNGLASYYPNVDYSSEEQTTSDVTGA